MYSVSDYGPHGKQEADLKDALKKAPLPKLGKGGKPVKKGPAISLAAAPASPATSSPQCSSSCCSSACTRYSARTARPRSRYRSPGGKRRAGRQREGHQSIGQRPRPHLRRRPREDSTKDPTQASRRPLRTTASTPDELGTVALTIASGSGFKFWFLTLAAYHPAYHLPGSALLVPLAPGAGSGHAGLTFGQSKAG